MFCLSTSPNTHRTSQKSCHSFSLSRSPGEREKEKEGGEKRNQIRVKKEKGKKRENYISFCLTKTTIFSHSFRGGEWGRDIRTSTIISSPFGDISREKGG